MGVACSKHDASTSNSHHNQHQTPYNHHVVSSPPPSGGLFSSCMSSCSGMDPAVDPRMDSCRADAIDPVMYDLCKKSLNMTLHDQETKKKEQQEAALPSPSLPYGTTQSSSKQRQRHQQQHQQQRRHVGQFHLLYKHQTKAAAAASISPNNSQAQSSQPQVPDAADSSLEDISTVPSPSRYSTRLIVRRRPIAAAEEGTHGTHLYAIRYPPDDVAPTSKMMPGTASEPTRLQEQAPSRAKERKKRGSDPAEPTPEPPVPSPASLPTEGLIDFFQPSRMKQSKTARRTSKYRGGSRVDCWLDSKLLLVSSHVVVCLSLCTLSFDHPCAYFDRC